MKIKNIFSGEMPIVIAFDIDDSLIIMNQLLRQISTAGERWNNGSTRIKKGDETRAEIWIKLCEYLERLEEEHSVPIFIVLLTSKDKFDKYCGEVCLKLGKFLRAVDDEGNLVPLVGMNNEGQLFYHVDFDNHMQHSFLDSDKDEIVKENGYLSTSPALSPVMIVNNTLLTPLNAQTTKNKYNLSNEEYKLVKAKYMAKLKVAKLKLIAMKCQIPKPLRCRLSLSDDNSAIIKQANDNGFLGIHLPMSYLVNHDTGIVTIQSNPAEVIEKVKQHVENLLNERNDLHETDPNDNISDIYPENYHDKFIAEAVIELIAEQQERKALMKAVELMANTPIGFLRYPPVSTDNIEKWPPSATDISDKGLAR